jgi:hypothetical protein
MMMIFLELVSFALIVSIAVAFVSGFIKSIMKHLNNGRLD